MIIFYLWEFSNAIVMLAYWRVHNWFDVKIPVAYDTFSFSLQNGNVGGMFNIPFSNTAMYGMDHNLLHHFFWIHKSPP